MAFLPDGKALITTAGYEHEVKILEFPSGRLLQQIDTVMDIHRFALAPDGKQFAVAGFLPSKDGQRPSGVIGVFDLPSGKIVKTLLYKAENKGEFGSFAFSQDGKLLFCVGDRKDVLLVFEISSGKELARKKFPSELANAKVNLSNDGAYVAGCASKDKIVLWKWQTEEPRFLDFPWHFPVGITFSPDGRMLAGLDSEASLRVWEVASGQLMYQQKSLEPNYSFFGAPTFTPDGKTLALMLYHNKDTLKGKIQLLDARTGRWRGVLESATRGGLFCSPDSRTLAMTHGSGVRFWDLSSRKEVMACESHQDRPSQIIVSPKGVLVTAGEDCTVRVWDAASTKQRNKFILERWVRAIALSPDGGLLAVSSLDDAVHIWDMPTGKEIYRLAGHGQKGGKLVLGFFPDGKSLLSWGDDFYLRLWDMKTGKARLEHAIQPPNIDPNEDILLWELGQEGAAVTPDGKTLVLGFDKHFHFFDTLTGKEMLVHPGVDMSIRCSISISPNNRYLLASTLGQDDGNSHKRSVFLVDLFSKTTLQHLKFPDSNGTAGQVAFSGNGKMFAVSVGEPQREILAFETATGKVRAAIRCASSPVWSLAFFPDGRRLASGQGDGTIVIWDLTSPEHLHKGQP